MTGDARPGPVPPAIGALAAPLYRFEIGRRNRAYDRGAGVTTLDRPVISVGNLSVGGTGKTPTVRAILRILLEHGRTPCVAMRGYKATPRRESDEAAAHRRAFPAVPIVAQPDRIAGLRALFETQIGRGVDCVVLDDGFQHRRLARSLDVVLVDATRPPFADKLLPAGWLREPPAALGRADVVLVTHADRVRRETLAALESSIRDVAPDAVLATSRHAWAELAVVEEGAERTEPVAWLAGRRVAAACAIGNPDPFLDALTEACAPDGPDAPRGTIVHRTVLRDHDPYDAPSITRITDGARTAGAEAVVITEKDWSKLRTVADTEWPCPIVRPRLRIELMSAAAEFTHAVLNAARAPEGA
ncbi:MAG: tetraacyldisaccharide 4'-kinase [Phycisphaeraceae bacterium]|nr:MAG: tetraacyldisaccharide 4'-kinase [Phycisphaeraceae bacterium]